MSEMLLYLYFLLGLVPFGLLLAKKSSTAFQAFPIIPLIWLIFISTLYEFLFSYVLKVDARYWFRLYTLLEFAAAYCYFRGILPNYSKALNLSLFAYLIVFSCFLSFWDLETSMRDESYLSVLSTVFVAAASLLWFKDIFSSGTSEPVTRSPDFYFICGLLLFFLGTLCLYLLGDDILKSSGLEILKYWNLAIFFNVVLRLLVSVGTCKLVFKMGTKSSNGGQIKYF